MIKKEDELKARLANKASSRAVNQQNKQKSDNTQNLFIDTKLIENEQLITDLEDKINQLQTQENM